jgi:hypothetical protein
MQFLLDWGLIWASGFWHTVLNVVAQPFCGKVYSFNWHYIITLLLHQTCTTLQQDVSVWGAGKFKYTTCPCNMLKGCLLQVGGS